VYNVSIRFQINW